jgi:hypothetical protein
MAEGLGVAASAVGIATAAIQSVQFLFKTIDNIKDVPNIIKSVRVDFRTVEPILRQLDTGLAKRRFASCPEGRDQARCAELRQSMYVFSSSAGSLNETLY